MGTRFRVWRIIISSAPGNRSRHSDDFIGWKPCSDLGCVVLYLEQHNIHAQSTIAQAQFSCELSVIPPSRQHQEKRGRRGAISVTVDGWSATLPSRHFSGVSDSVTITEV